MRGQRLTQIPSYALSPCGWLHGPPGFFNHQQHDSQEQYRNAGMQECRNARMREKKESKEKLEFRLFSLAGQMSAPTEGSATQGGMGGNVSLAAGNHGRLQNLANYGIGSTGSNNADGWPYPTSGFQEGFSFGDNEDDHTMSSNVGARADDRRTRQPDDSLIQLCGGDRKFAGGVVQSRIFVTTTISSPISRHTCITIAA